MKKKKAKIVLEDGKIFNGFSFGAEGETSGEVVFNTSMTGYQEIITDPSYKGQIVTMTYPLIGNYGVNDEDVESRRPSVEGFVVKECSRVTSSWRSQMGLGQYLERNGILGIEWVDTRALTKHIRQKGSMKAVISTTDLDDASLIEKARKSPGIVGRDLVKEVKCEEAFQWNEKGKYHVAVLDCGVKFNILRRLAENDCRVTVFPPETSAELILDASPDGILLSNGPGDPEGVPYVVETVKELLGKLPVFGICLGHQMLGLALGGKTYKLKFGHHGGNHPVKDLKTGSVAITVQNHNFCVDLDSLREADVKVTHINLNDNTVEGMRHRKMPVFSVQFHPEYGPGPHDSAYLFGEFVHLMEGKSA
ncbi:MAG: glutamine-hydrolyzing carbamoyl-phosphate synthase small subunit [Candidatus Omnitrophica bacterium]|nr:glutamine-hydrolyzing carbamoyl-phosphate synthase small subunit [Candidatus Omnitrophota bacterium]